MSDRNKRNEHAATRPSSDRAVASSRQGVGTEPQWRRARGQEGEDIATAHLRALEGWTILARNVYFRAGELDIIATDGSELVFVEVRSRWTQRGPRAEDSVTRTKQRRLTIAAQLWLQRNSMWRRHRARFDVIAVDLRAGRVAAHHRSAFHAVR